VVGNRGGAVEAILGFGPCLPATKLKA